jgi:spore maturation protein A
MNAVFTLLFLASAIFMIATNPTEIFPSMIEGVSGAINLLIKLTAIYSIWLSVLKLAERTGLDHKLSNLLKPIVKKLFKGENDDAYKWISINLASNMLGMGGASTPAGIKAMEKMQKGDKATANMDLLVVINATSIQLIPATVIALRASWNSQNPSSIILPTLISSTIATVIGVILSKTFSSKDTDTAILSKPKPIHKKHQSKATNLKRKLSKGAEK